MQVIVPGYRCPANAFFAQCLCLCGTDHLHITSANRSRHATGAAEEPAHFRAAALRADFDDDSRLVVLEHTDEEAALASYPQHAPMSTTVIGFRAPGAQDSGGRTVTLERHGSLPVRELRPILADHDIDLVVPASQRRLRQRIY